MEDQQTMTPQELLESFIVHMKMYHGIKVTEINFDQQSYDRLNLVFKAKERIALNDGNLLDNYNPRISSIGTSAGIVDLGVKENA